MGRESPNPSMMLAKPDQSVWFVVSVDSDQSPEWSLDNSRIAYVRIPASDRAFAFGPERKASHGQSGWQTVKVVAAQRFSMQTEAPGVSLVMWLPEVRSFGRLASELSFRGRRVVGGTCTAWRLQVESRSI